MRRMSVFHQNSGNLLGVGDGFPNTEFWWSTDILLIINPSTGMDQEIHPSRQGRIDSVKINASPLRMRECVMFSSSIWSSLIFHSLIAFMVNKIESGVELLRQQ